MRRMEIEAAEGGHLQRVLLVQAEEAKATHICGSRVDADAVSDGAENFYPEGQVQW